VIKSNKLSMRFLYHCSLISIDTTSTCYFNINARICQCTKISTHVDTILGGRLASRYYVVCMPGARYRFALPARLCLFYCYYEHVIMRTWYNDNVNIISTMIKLLLYHNNVIIINAFIMIK
jgi:hypothetical protein